VYGKPVFGCFAGLASCALFAQAAPNELARPPGDARHFIIQSAAAKHGDSWSWTTPDGTRMGRETLDLAGEVWDSDASATLAGDGTPSSLSIHGVSPQGVIAETFSISSGRAQWKSAVDAGSARYQDNSFYLPKDGPIDSHAWLLERLLKRPDRSLALLPGGRAHATALGSIEVGDSGATRKTITLWGVSGLDTEPTPMWADADGKFFAQTAGVGWLPAEYAGEQQHLQQAQTAAMAVQSAALAKELRVVPSTPVAFVNVRILDSQLNRFLTHQTVVVDKGVITAVGPSTMVKVPSGAKIIAGHAMTLVPGLWDCHLHLRSDYAGVQELSLGVTSVCDPGNVDPLTLDRRARVASGQLLFPNVYHPS
jgi:hypothetical protein